MRLERDVSLQTAITSPTLRTAFRGHDGVAYSVAHVLCKRFLGAFTFATKLEPAQVETFTVDTLEHFEYETLDDLVLFFKMARSGKFGTAKKGIDSNLVYGDWLPKYLELKAIEREKAVHAEKIKKTTSPNSLQQVKQAYAQIAKRRKRKEAQRRIDALVKNWDRQMLEDAIIGWAKDPELSKYVKYLKTKRKTLNQ